MRSDPKIENLFAKFLHPAAVGNAVSAQPVASVHDDRIEKTAAMRGTAREVIDAKPDNLVVPTTPNTTTSEQSGGKSKK